MAIASPLNLQQITTGVRSLGVAVTRAQVSANRSAGILVNRNKIKRKLVFGDRLSFDRRRERVRRRRQEDIIESSTIGGFIKNRGLALANSTRGFLGRIMDFLGTLLVGWLLNNLPTIISMAQELMARIGRLVNILGGFVTNIGKSLQSFGKVLGAVGQNIINFDFLDSNKRVQTAMDDLNSVFDDMNTQIDDGLKLFTTSLGEGLVSGEDAAPTGTDYTTQPEVTDTSGTPGTAGKLQPIHKQALDIISKPESGGDYNAMNRGTAADSLGGSKKWIGKNLTDMTIGEVISLQSQGKLHAAGRYQFVPRSLPTAKASAGLKDTDRFDKNNQDLLAIGLLKTQGPGAWTPYSKYSKKEIDIMYKAKDTPLGAATPAAPAQTPTAPSPAQITPTPPPAPIQPGKKLTGGDILTKSLGRGVQYIEITSGYGSRGGGHMGLDIAAPEGTYIALRYDCEVVAAGVYGNYGYLMDVWIPQLGVQLRMAHLSAILIKSGKIKSGTSFARVGSTGRSTGPHIHLEYSTKRNSSNYGGSGDPSPYVSALLLTKNPNQGSFGIPSQAQIAAPTPAQIAAQPSQRRQELSSQVTPQRVGQKIVIIDNMQPPQIPSAPPSGGGSMGFIPIQTNSLNSYITKKLLLDLAYT
jgi:murein DD-endopeptidase MepM/ murein hydrolase activator NlpD